MLKQPVSVIHRKIAAFRLLSLSAWGFIPWRAAEVFGKPRVAICPDFHKNHAHRSSDNGNAAN
ncbi:MAG: hypothetical protein B6245_17090 [Desulfobacteraceae bacterium 4572_88]|nr:MAG: hypothetical protein B6245_17090 [Desulfobacteraceae bacterium 4572_88]